MIVRDQQSNDDLRATLARLVRSRPGSNPAFEALLRDFRRYHLVLAVLSSAFGIAFLAFGVFMAIRFRTTRRVHERRWRFARQIYLSAGVISLSLGMLMALIFAANFATALHPRQGFTGSIGMLGTPRDGTDAHQLQQAFDDWLLSARPVPPPTVQRAVKRRLAWQRPKAVTCTVLLLLVAALGAWAWRSTLAESCASCRWRSVDTARLVGALLSVPIGLTAMLMVMGNTQASFAPLVMTLFYG